MKYRVKVIRHDAELHAIESAWQRLLLQAPTATVFASQPWNAVWWEHFGAGAHLSILAVYNGAEELVGVAPLLLRRTGLIRKLELIGTGLSDTGDFVLRPDCAGAVIQAIFAYLHTRRQDWDLLDLDEVPPYSLLAAQMQAAPPAGLRLLRRSRSDNPAVALPGSWAEYRRQVPRRWRTALERPRISETARVEFAVVQEAAQMPAAVDQLYALHRARWATRPDNVEAVHLTPTFARFLAEVSSRLAAGGWVRLTELHLDGRVIAAALSFLVNGRWNGYLKGFDPQWAAKSPGQVLDTFTIKCACDEQAVEFDFGRGNEPYKYRYGAANRKNLRLVISSPTLRSQLGRVLTQARIEARTRLNRVQAGRAARQAQATLTPATDDVP